MAATLREQVDEIITDLADIQMEMFGLETGSEADHAALEEAYMYLKDAIDALEDIHGDD